MPTDVKLITTKDDLPLLVSQINAAQWDEVNEIQQYNADALRAYLERADTVFVACFLHSDEETVFAGMASARLEHKPYDDTRWLYIDEVDTCSNLRKRGVGTAMMNKLKAIADDLDCDEIWLGADRDNTDANTFYESLKPDSIDPVVGYTFELEE